MGAMGALGAVGASLPPCRRRCEWRCCRHPLPETPAPFWDKIMPAAIKERKKKKNHQKISFAPLGQPSDALTRHRPPAPAPAPGGSALGALLWEGGATKRSYSAVAFVYPKFRLQWLLNLVSAERSQNVTLGFGGAPSAPSSRAQTFLAWCRCWQGFSRRDYVTRCRTKQSATQWRGHAGKRWQPSSESQQQITAYNSETSSLTTTNFGINYPLI